MKALVLRIFTAALVGCVLSHAAFASHGGADGAGGDFPKSTPEQVRKAVDEVWNYSLKSVFYNLAYYVEHNYFDIPKTAWKFYNLPIAPAQIRIDQPIFKDIAATKYSFVEGAGCIEGGDPTPHAAGVGRFALGEPICLSMKHLQQVPPDSLSNHLSALFAHEFAHHFGLQEAEAVEFQDFILNKMNALNPSRAMVYFRNLDLDDLPVVSPDEIDPYKEYYVNIRYQNGKRVDLNPATENAPTLPPSCSLEIHFGGSKDRSGPWIVSPFAADLIPNGGGEIVHDGKAVGFHRHFELNTQHGSGNPAGVGVFREFGSHDLFKPDATILNIDCAGGPTTEFTDLMRSFGDAISFEDLRQQAW